MASLEEIKPHLKLQGHNSPSWVQSDKDKPNFSFAKTATMSENSVEIPNPSQHSDVGHQGDFDYVQIRKMLALTPTQRLDKHEGWRLFVKEALRNAKCRKATRRGG